MKQIQGEHYLKRFAGPFPITVISKVIDFRNLDAAAENVFTLFGAESTRRPDESTAKGYCVAVGSLQTPCNSCRLRMAS
ncbi:MAG: hypothetical protein ACK443_12230 [Methylococcaceae bacterium]